MKKSLYNILVIIILILLGSACSNTLVSEDSKKHVLNNEDESFATVNLESEKIKKYYYPYGESMYADDYRKYINVYIQRVVSQLGKGGFFESNNWETRYDSYLDDIFAMNFYPFHEKHFLDVIFEEDHEDKTKSDSEQGILDNSSIVNSTSSLLYNHLPRLIYLGVEYNSPINLKIEQKDILIKKLIVSNVKGETNVFIFQGDGSQMVVTSNDPIIYEELTAVSSMINFLAEYSGYINYGAEQKHNH